MSFRALAIVLVLLSATVGGNAELVADLLSPSGHTCGERCCCGNDEPAKARTAAGCCATKGVTGPQLRAGCGCGQHEEQATAQVASPTAKPDATAAPVAAPPRLAGEALPQQFPPSFRCAPDPPPPRSA